MGELLAMLMMLGPWASEADVDRERAAYSEALQDCSAWIAPDTTLNITGINERGGSHKFGVCLSARSVLLGSATAADEPTKTLFRMR